MADAAATSRKIPASRSRKKKPAENEEAKAKQAEREAEADEPAIKWKNSKAKQLLYKDIMNGRVPLEAKTANGKSTMSLKDIYNHRPEFKEYHYSKFSSRLSSLRKTIKENNYRAELDQEAFNNYIKHTKTASFSHKGYIQWQGSDAQELCRQDIKNGLHTTMSRMDLYGSRREYYENFPLDAFRDKVRQELRTAKYLHTLEVKGKDPR